MSLFPERAGEAKRAKQQSSHLGTMDWGPQKSNSGPGFSLKRENRPELSIHDCAAAPAGHWR